MQNLCIKHKPEKLIKREMKAGTKPNFAHGNNTDAVAGIVGYV